MFYLVGEDTDQFRMRPAHCESYGTGAKMYVPKTLESSIVIYWH